jgi:hypothetical protein
MKTFTTLFSILTLLTFSSCSTKQEHRATPTALASNEPSQSDQNSTDKVEIATERKITKEGDIAFETTNLNETKSLVTKSIEELNGYISKDVAYEYPDRLEHRIVIRVPANKFDVLLNKISASVEKLDSKNIDVLDVTKEYIDIEARIKTKKELELRYKEILKLSKTVSEILSIEKEIGLLRTEIESFEGQMRYLKDRISYSTLTVIYYQKTSAEFRFTSKFKQAFKDGWDYFLTFIIGLTHLWMFILIGSLAAFVYSQFKKRRTK